jgi:hypothetical protein
MGNGEMSMPRKDVPRYFTVFSSAQIGGEDFSKVYVLENTFRSMHEIKKKLPKLFNNCTACIANDTIWVIREVLCKKQMKKLKSGGVDKMVVVTNDLAIDTDDVCSCCRNLVREYVGECRNEYFLFTTKKRRSFFLKEDFKSYKRLKEVHVLRVAELMYDKLSNELKLSDKAAMRLAVDAVYKGWTKCGERNVFNPSNGPLINQMALMRFEEVCDERGRKKKNIG